MSNSSSPCQSCVQHPKNRKRYCALYNAAYPPPEGKRNLMLCNVPRNVEDRDLYFKMTEYGYVEAWSVRRHVYTGISKGTAFVRFATPAEAQAALTALHHSTWGGHKITVKWSTTEKVDTPGPWQRWFARKLFVRNVPLDVTEAQLRAVASRCGGVARVELRADTQPDPQRPRRIAFITFAEDGAAEAALYALHHTAPFVSCGDVPLLCKLKEEYLPLPPCSVRVGKNRYHHDPYRFTVLPLPTAMAGAVM